MSKKEVKERIQAEQAQRKLLEEQRELIALVNEIQRQRRRVDSIVTTASDIQDGLEKMTVFVQQYSQKMSLQIQDLKKQLEEAKKPKVAKK